MSTATTKIIEPTLSWLSLDEWQAFASSRPESNVFHHEKWLRMLMDQYGFGLQIPAIKRDGNVLAAVPFMETTSARGKRKLISLPFTDCVRILAVDASAEKTLCRAFTSESFGDYASVLMKTDQSVAAADTASEWVRHELSTSAPLHEIHRGFATGLKRNLRKAEKSGLRFEQRSDENALWSFYRLHLTTRKRLGVPVQPKSFFRRLLNGLLQEHLGYIGLVMLDDKPLAAGVFLTFNKTTIYKYGASDPRSLEFRPNEWMMYNAIRQAAQCGHTTFDFGISERTQDGLRRFKSKWGSVETDVYNHCLAGENSRSVMVARAMPIVSLAIRHAPPIVCQTLGEVFYKYSA
jgi:lipid II:glycine glycyltransferase (peptidoglycan interpeptide bridge formation enzyme)